MNALKIHQIYLDELTKNIDEIIGNTLSLDNLKKLVLYGVKTNSAKENKEHEPDLALDSYHLVINLINRLTPRQILTIFPIEKTYDGEKFGSKDYFYTTKKIKEHGLDNKINDAFSFLWDYMNLEISMFIVGYISALSDARKKQTGTGIMEEFAAENGLKTYTMYEVDGKEIPVENLVINKNGKVV